MPPAVMTVNGVDLATFGMWVNSPTGWGDAPVVRDTLLNVPGRAGGILSPGEATIGSRMLEVSGVLIADSDSAARSQWDDAKKFLASPILEIAFALWPDRVAYGRYKNIVWAQVGAIQSGLEFQLSFVLPSPYMVARSVDIYAAGHGQRIPLTLGTAASDLQLRLVGLGTAAPQVAYLDAQGLVAGSFLFDLIDSLGTTLALGLAEWIEIDTETHGLLWHKADGTVVNAAPYLSISSSFFTADPQDGDDDQGPVLVPSNCSMVALCRKAWL